LEQLVQERLADEMERSEEFEAALEKSNAHSKELQVTCPLLPLSFSISHPPHMISH
jgi:hypothetical protein